MTRRAAALAALAAALLPAPAPAADADVPVARVGAPLAGEAPAASLLRPATVRTAFRVPPADTALYVGTPWFVRDLSVTVVGPGARRHTIAGATDLPGRMLGLRLPADAWQADRIELESTTVSLAAPPYLLTAEQLAQIAWRTWWYAAVFGALAALAIVHGILAATLRSRASGRLAAALAAQAGLTIPWLGIVRPPPSVSQPLHAVLQSLAIIALTLFAFAYADRVRFAPRVRFAMWSLVALNTAAIAGGDVMQDLWPLPDAVAQAALAALNAAFVAIATVAARANIAGARYYVAATAVAALGFVLGIIPANDALLQAAPLSGTALAAPLLALALFAQRQSRERERAQRDRPVHLDGLTAIANRPALDEALESMCEHAARTRAPLAALLVDIDHFRSFNELYGHHAGDDALRQVAAALSDFASRRKNALAGRYGGEEFLVLLPATNVATAQKLADTVLEAIAALQIAHGGTPLKRLTASIGIAAMLPANQTLAAAAEELVRRASTALYVAKTMGRARAVADEPILAPPPRMARS